MRAAADDPACSQPSGARAKRAGSRTNKRAARISRGGPKRPAAAHGDIYAEVTARIVAELEQGRLPWVQPWGNAGAPAPGLPCNAITSRDYSGINVLILWAAVMERGWPCQRWLTFKQALAAGGNVRKGERGTTIVYADRFTPEAERERASEAGDGKDDQAAVRGTDDRPRRAIPFLKRFTVFNVAQINGLAEPLAPSPQPLGERETVAVGETLIAASGVEFRVGGTAAYYAPGPDYVAVPPQQAFFEQINYYRTAFHELTHATGHASRLGRDQSGAFGSAAYAREELVAELGAAFLCASLGIAPTVRHADYIGNWLTVLRSDLSEDAAVRGTGAPRGRAIFRAAAASRAADWLLARFRTADTDALAAPEIAAAA